MIDFRYHIVSLISVFIALAVGVILGAGPLKESIGDQLTGQVDSLRADREQMRADLDLLEKQYDQSRASNYNLATQLSKDSLKDVAVAVVELGKRSERNKTDVAQLVQSAGGIVVAELSVNESWFTSSEKDIRNYANSVSEILPALPQELLSDADYLTLALVRSLATTEPGNLQVLEPQSQSVIDLLVTGELITVKTFTNTPAQALIVINNDEPVIGEDLEKGDIESSIEQRISFVRQGSSFYAATVLGSQSIEKNSVIEKIQTDGALAKEVTTVAQIEEQFGQNFISLATRLALLGEVEHFALSQAVDDNDLSKIDNQYPLLQTDDMALGDEESQN